MRSSKPISPPCSRASAPRCASSARPAAPVAHVRRRVRSRRRGGISARPLHRGKESPRGVTAWCASGSIGPDGARDLSRARRTRAARPAHRAARDDRPRPMVLLVHGGPWRRTTGAITRRTVPCQSRLCRPAGQLSRLHRLRAICCSPARASLAARCTTISSTACAGGRTRHRRSEACRDHGGSYGGYAALSGAAFTPDVFVAAVDRSGSRIWLA